MAILLPLRDYKQSAEILRNDDLVGIILEVKSALDYLHETSKTSNHSSSIDSWEAWRGFELALCGYYFALSDELTDRFKSGLKLSERVNSDIISSSAEVSVHFEYASSGSVNADRPPWTEEKSSLDSHKRSLLRKAPGYYSAFFPNVFLTEKNTHSSRDT